MTTINYEMENKQKFFMHCLLHGVNHVSVRFSGSGDSGDYDTAVFNNDWKHPALTSLIKWYRKTSQFNEETKGWDPDFQLAIITLEAAAGDLASNAVEDTGIDWYNDEGGGGQWEIANGAVSLDIYVNQTSSEDVHSSEIPQHEYITGGLA